MHRFIFFILLIFIGIGSAYAQTQPDTVVLKELTIEATRIRKPATKQSISISTIDSTRIELLSISNISVALSTYAPVNIRTNGPGGLATLSQRGYSSSQTQILWNGFQLNHSMLGLTDLSLIPGFAIQKITIASGSGNNSFGEKGGGTVAISTKETANEFGASQTFGSFNKLITETYAGINFGKWSMSLITGHENSDNNFTYSIREFSNQAGGFVQVEKKRINNELTSKTGLLSLNWTEGKKNFSSILWIYDATNNIPGGITSQTPNSYQEDSYLRWMNKYSTTYFGQELNSKVYFNRQQLNYFNPDSDLYSLSTSIAFVGDVELLSPIHKTLEFITSIQLGHTFVDASDYSGLAERTQFTIQTNPMWQPVNPVNFYGGFRFDYYSDFKTAYSTSVGTNIELLKENLYLKGHISRNFIAPTFNDLFWPRLGNPNLNPETNLKYETSLLLEKTLYPFANSIEFTIYDGIVKDGIRWLPGSDGQSRPENLERVQLSGFELKDEFWFESGDFRFDIQGILLHTIAKLKKPRFEGDRAEGKQLRYTPEWQFKANTLIKWRKFASVFTYNFAEERFSTADHNSPFDPLSSYTETSWSSYLDIKISGFKIIPQFTIQNLFDEEYSIIRDYPMPKRNYQAKITIKYKIR